MNVWFPGTEGAEAICDVLFGDKNPSGKLTVSMPQHVGQEPLYYNQLPTGRPVGEGADKFVLWKSNYLDVRNDPLFPFGFGLSYTGFDYGDMKISKKDDGVTVTVDVTNSGDMDGHETVQCYIRDIACRYSRPVKELKGFERIFLKKGETKTVTITLSQEDLSFYDSDGNLIFEPGEFDIMIGPDSKNLQSQRIYINGLQGKMLSVIGDSEAAGDKNGLENTYPNYIAQRNNMKVNNLALNGQKLCNARPDEWPALINYYKKIPKESDYILVHIGYNDDFNTSEDNESVDSLSFKGAFNHLIAGLRYNYPDAHIGVICPYYFNGEQSRIDRAGWIKQRCRQLQVQCLDGCAASGLDRKCETQRDMFRDEVHLTPKGHMHVSHIYEQFLRRL